jgi:hypothetical protein
MRDRSGSKATHGEMQQKKGREKEDQICFGRLKYSQKERIKIKKRENHHVVVEIFNSHNSTKNLRKIARFLYILHVE